MGAMMDVCTSLVQAYLHVNGYFTATDYPVVESLRDSAPRTVTDFDLLAVRFGRSTEVRVNPREGGRIKGLVATNADPTLDCPHDRTDMIVAEVKQGRAKVNPAARKHHVLAAALSRFGCCDMVEAPHIVQALLRHGRAQGSHNHVVRMVLFASSGEHAPRGWHWVQLDHVFLYLDDYLRRDRGGLGKVDLHDPALAWLSLVNKCHLALEPVAKGGP